MKNGEGEAKNLRMNNGEQGCGNENGGQVVLFPHTAHRLSVHS